MAHYCRLYAGVLALSYLACAQYHANAVPMRGAPASPPAADFYVAENGNDAWSGTLPSPNANSTDGPFASVARAQTAVQGLVRNAGGRTSPVMVLLRGGTYYQQSLTFTAADSGTAALRVIWQNYPKEAPVLSGGIAVSGWSSLGSGRYQAALPTTTRYFENLFYNGKRRLRPRSGGYLGTYLRIAAPIYVSGSAPPAPPPETNCSLYVQGKGWQCYDRFQANCSDVSTSWQNLYPPYPAGDIELVDFEWWTVSRLRVQSVDPSCVVRLTGPTLTDTHANTHGFIANHRYILENVKDVLTEPGQWFLDRSAIPWTLTYIANSGENPVNATIVVPQSSQVLAATDLQYVTFKGLLFKHDNYTVPDAGYPSRQQDPDITASAGCYNCQYVTFDGVTIAETSGTGIEFVTTNSGATTAYNSFINGAFYDIGATAIRVGKPPATSDTDANVPQFTDIENNLIEGYSRVFPSGVGIVQGSGHDNLYTHNDIYDGYHSGIEICQPSACAPGAKNSLGSFNNVVSFNHVFNIFEGVTDDGGAVYISTGGPSYTPAGNRVLNNRIHDLSDASKVDSDGYGGHGIYLDSYTGLVDVENNLIYRVSGSAIKITSGPALMNQANTLKNNILAYPRQGAIANSNPYSTTTCPATVPTIFNATNNLVYFDRTASSRFYVQQGCDYACGSPITAMHNWQSNLYWRTDAAFESDTNAFHVQSSPGRSALCTMSTGAWTFYTFAQWQGLGEDAGSIANRDPGFAAPVYPKDDYSLPLGSPGAGFVVFDPKLPGRSKPLIKPANPQDVAASFPTANYDPGTDY